MPGPAQPTWAARTCRRIQLISGRVFHPQFFEGSAISSEDALCFLRCREWTRGYQGTWVRRRMKTWGVYCDHGYDFDPDFLLLLRHHQDYNYDLWLLLSLWLRLTIGQAVYIRVIWTYTSTYVVGICAHDGAPMTHRLPFFFLGGGGGGVGEGERERGGGESCYIMYTDKYLIFVFCWKE